VAYLVEQAHQHFHYLGRAVAQLGHLVQRPFVKKPYGVPRLEDILGRVMLHLHL
jgi:hypothetical protein